VATAWNPGALDGVLWGLPGFFSSWILGERQTLICSVFSLACRRQFVIATGA
jgi:hypothetical protein